MKKEIRIALLGLVTLFLTIWGYKFISGTNMFSGDKVYYALFDNVSEVNTATPVQINGLNVGTVVSLEPESNNVSKIKLGFQIQKEIKLPKDAIVELRSAGALGGKMIELVFTKMCEGSNCAEPQSILDSRSVGLLGSLISEEELSPVLKEVTGGIDKTISGLGDPNSSAPIDVSVDNLNKTMSNMVSISSDLAKVMSKSARNMEITLANTAVLTEGLVQSSDKLAEMLNNLNALTSDLSKVKLSETIDKANGTVDQATVSLKNIETTMAEATTTMKDLQSLIQSMNSSEGTLGKMMNDKELYDNLESTTDNMNLLLQDIRLNPRRYFKIFGKKVPDYEYPDEDPADGLDDNSGN